MNWFSFLRSAPNAAEKTIETIQRAGDAVWFTDEEKAQYKKECFKLWADSLAQIDDQNSPRSLTRRYLAVMAFGQWIFLCLFSVIIYPFNNAYSAYVFGLVAEQSPIILGVSMFYFGPHMIGRAVKSAKQ